MRRSAVGVRRLLPSSCLAAAAADQTPATTSTVASRGSRQQHRHLAASLGGLGGDAVLFNDLRWRKKKLKFEKSPIHAWGLYAVEPIEAGDFVVEYIGEYIRTSVAEARERHYRRLNIGDDYIFRVNEEWQVDATKKGGLARFANHCCDPNCYTRIIMMHGKPRIVLYTKRGIEAGEEITYDYKFEREVDPKLRIPCQCGARRCAGFLN